MRVAFRVDASLDIGTGHVMRCLTLADALRSGGSECSFICRENPGNLVHYVRQRGFHVEVLPVASRAQSEIVGGRCPDGGPRLSHARWLGVAQQEDAAATASVLHGEPLDWLVVDNYALDVRWERRLRDRCGCLLVIDDLADRGHDCDLLLDQTHGRRESDYKSLVPLFCSILCGASYALLRPEFSEQRHLSLARRRNPRLKRVLLTMGGVDKENLTAAALHALASVPLPEAIHVTVVMGSAAPWLEHVRKIASDMPFSAEVLVGVRDMARLMTESDLAIGAAGATSWERCCLGLPTVLVVLADNQRSVARGLAEAGAAVVLERGAALEQVLPEIMTDLMTSPERLRELSTAASRIVDGRGTAKLVAEMEAIHASN